MTSGGDVVTESSLTVEPVKLEAQIVKGPLLERNLQASNVGTISGLCDFPSVLAAGSIAPNIAKGSYVFSYQVAPARLKTEVNLTRLSHMSDNFAFWHGEITFRMVVTKTILQQTKLVFYFVPISQGDVDNVDEAVMFQHHVIINPDNCEKVDFHIPFISTRPYHGVAEPTGTVICRVFQGFVNSVDGGGSPLGWTLFVKSKSVVFRDVVPLPPALE